MLVTGIPPCVADPPSSSVPCTVFATRRVSEEVSLLRREDTGRGDLLPSSQCEVYATGGIPQPLRGDGEVAPDTDHGNGQPNACGNGAIVICPRSLNKLLE